MSEEMVQVPRFLLKKVLHLIEKPINDEGYSVFERSSGTILELRAYADGPEFVEPELELGIPEQGGAPTHFEIREKDGQTGFRVPLTQVEVIETLEGVNAFDLQFFLSEREGWKCSTRVEVGGVRGLGSTQLRTAPVPVTRTFAAASFIVREKIARAWQTLLLAQPERFPRHHVQHVFGCPGVHAPLQDLAEGEMICPACAEGG